jgi:thiamine biosynthesis protein ThiS
MRLVINGTPQEHADLATVQDLLNTLGFGEKPVVVELNQRALFQRELATTKLAEADVIEIVQITAGG